jgi:hypothetical protein
MNFSIKTFPVYVALLVATSCGDKNGLDTINAEENGFAETEFMYISDAVCEYLADDAHTGKTGEFLLPGNVAVVFSDSSFTDGNGVICSIDYGNLENGSSKKGILCSDGRYRAGKINLYMNKRWSQLPCTVDISISNSDNYFSGNGTDMYHISGVKRIVRNSEDTYVHTVTNAKIARPSGTISWNSERVATRVLDAGLPGIAGDKFEISGTSSGTNSMGEMFSVETISPLEKIVQVGCSATFVSGELQITNPDGKELTVDYDPFGNKACDKSVKIKSNGQERIMNLW